MFDIAKILTPRDRKILRETNFLTDERNKLLKERQNMLQVFFEDPDLTGENKYV